MRTFDKALLLFFLLTTVSSAYCQTIIELQPGPTEGKDARVWSLNPTGNFGDYEFTKMNAWTWGGIFGIERTYIEFDLDTIPENATVSEATLSLYYHYLPGNPEQTHSGSNSLLIQRCTSPWDEFDVTWNKQPGITTVSQVTFPPSSGPQVDYLDIDVTSLILDVLNNENYGFLLRIKTEETFRRVALSSSDHPDPSRWPKLVIHICEPPEAGWTYIQDNYCVTFTDTSLNATSWLWDFGDGCFSYQQHPVHCYAEHGDYWVTLEASNECGSDTTGKIVRLLFTGIEEVTGYQQIKIIPNPVEACARIVIGDPGHAPGRITIYSAAGVLKESFVTKIQAGETAFRHDFGNYAPGVYLISYTSENVTHTQRFLVR